MSNTPEHSSLLVSDDDAGQRLDVFVAARLADLSRSRVQKLIDAGAVLVDGAVQPARHTLRPGARVDVDIPPPLPAIPQPQAMDLRVIHEDDHLLVLDKPPGLVVHPGAGQPDGTLVNALLARPGTVSVIGGVERPGIVHRLDKDTSGLMVVAKTDTTHIALTEALGRREVKRIYWAITLSRFKTPSGTIDAPIGRHPTSRTRMAVLPEGKGRPAVTHWKVLEEFAGISLVECRLATGRTHQIRVHLSHERHPILGDDLYNGSITVALQMVNPRDFELRNAIRVADRQMLHARELAFVHPATGKQMNFVCEPPQDFQTVLAALRTSVPS